MNFRYESRVGFPLQILTPLSEAPSPIFEEILKLDYRGFYKRGDLLGNFTFPKNTMIENRAELFARYGLYENRQGLLGLGEPFWVETYEMLSEDSAFLRTSQPLLVGDVWALDPQKKVIWALGTYRESFGIWETRVLWGDSPAPLDGPPSNNWTQNIVLAIDSITTAVEQFVGLCQSAGEGAPIVISGAKEAFEASMRNIKEKLEEVQL